jgi:plasmid maintenance system antidote protein VapI
MAEAKHQTVDDQGTTGQQGQNILRRLRDEGFDADDAQLARALGRPVEEVQAWLNGTTPVDDDLIMKARGLASERGINIE